MIQKRKNILNRRLKWIIQCLKKDKLSAIKKQRESIIGIKRVGEGEPGEGVKKEKVFKGGYCFIIIKIKKGEI